MNPKYIEYPLNLNLFASIPYSICNILAYSLVNAALHCTVCIQLDLHLALLYPIYNMGCTELQGNLRLPTQSCFFLMF